jgi:hypothetical protein
MPCVSRRLVSLQLIIRSAPFVLRSRPFWQAAVKAQEELEQRLSDERDAALLPIGNLVPDSVPVDDNEVGGDCCGYAEGGGSTEGMVCCKMSGSLRVPQGLRPSCSPSPSAQACICRSPRLGISCRAARRMTRRNS